MKKGTLLLVGAMLFAVEAFAIPLKTAKVTQTHNDVRLRESGGRSGDTGETGPDPSPVRSEEATQVRPAEIGDLVEGGRILYTGRKSRAELLFNDNTVARLGANSIFTFRPDSRNVHLSSGFLLIHTPKGKGGVTITTPTATAAVIGTTLMMSALPDGSIKVIVLEGTATLEFGGSAQTLTSGQLCIFTPGQGLSTPVTIDLAKLVASSVMITSFPSPLGSELLIEEAIRNQSSLIASGQLKITGDDQGLKVLGDTSIDSAIQQQTAKPNPPPSSPPGGGGRGGK